MLDHRLKEPEHVGDRYQEKIANVMLAKVLHNQPPSKSGGGCGGR
jgi:hypothetical protein